MPADLHELVDGHQPRKDRAIFDGDVAGQLRPVRDDDAIAKVTVVREVHVRHEEAVLPHGRAKGLRRPAVDRGVFTDPRAFTDLDPGLLALELEVLGITAKYRADADANAWREPHVALEDRARVEDAVVAHLAPVAHDHARTDLHVLPQARLV